MIHDYWRKQLCEDWIDFSSVSLWRETAVVFVWFMERIPLLHVS